MFLEFLEFRIFELLSKIKRSEYERGDVRKIRMKSTNCYDKPKNR